MPLNIKRLVFQLFLLWLFCSAFYYAGQLLDGNVVADRNSGLVHKALKYIISLTFSLLFILVYRSKALLLQYAFLLLMGLIVGFYWAHDYPVTYAIDVLIVLFSFLGLAYAVSRFGREEITVLTRVIIYSAVIVSTVSYLEYLFMEPVLGEYWRNTGGYRSISTLLNPNNLGLYLAASLLVMIFGSNFSVFFKSIFTAIVSGALLMSGSRTAWLSFILTFIFCYVYRGSGRLNFRHIVNVLIAFIAIGLALTASISLGLITLPERAVDMTTAYIRLEKYFQFIIGVDDSYIFPDFESSRIETVSESAYFHFINALGLFYSFALLSAFFLIVGLSGFLRLFSNSEHRVFAVVFLFYAIAMLFENVLMSFPNNQLFFISLSVILAGARGRYYRGRQNPIAANFNEARN